MIVPKSPIMVLNEMVGAVNYNFVDTHPPMPMQPGQPPMQLFTATCNVRRFRYPNHFLLQPSCNILYGSVE